jgi:putative membrane protein
MTTFVTVLSLLVAIEFFYILYLETFATTSASTGKVFSMTADELAQPKVQLLFRNQGIYNGLIAVGMLYATFVQRDLLVPLLVYILLVAAYGAFSACKVALFFKQGGLALLTLLLLLMG